MICPDCNELMIKTAVQNEEADWIVYWKCGCQLNTEMPIQEAGNKIGIHLFVHNGRCCDLEESFK